MLSPSGSLALWEKGNKTHELGCLGIQVEQQGTDELCLTEMVSEQALVIHIWIALNTKS